MAVSETTLNFATRYDGSGAKGVTDGLRQYGAALDDAQGKTDGFNSKTEGILKRLERPMGRTLYQSIAAGLLEIGGNGEKASGATMALERGLHAVGIAAMFAGGEFASIILIGASLITLFMKLKDTEGLTEKAVQDQTKSHRDRIELIKTSLPILKQAGIIDKEDMERLEKVKSLEEGEITNLRKKVEAQENEARTTLEKIKNEKNLSNSMDFKEQHEIRLEGAEKRLNDLTIVKLGLTSEAAKADKDEAKAIDDKWQMKIKELEVNTKLLEQKKLIHDFQNIDMAKVREIQALEAENVKLTDQMNSALTESAKKELEDHIKFNDAKIAADTKLLGEEKAIKDKEIAEIKKVSQEILGGSEAFMKDFVTGNKANLDKDLANWIDSYANKLYAAAVADAFVDPLKAAGELAGAIALTGLSAQFGGGGATVAGATAPTSSPSSSGGGGGPSPNNIGLTVVLQGTHVTDPNFAAYVTQQLNDYAQNSNGQVMATHYIDSNGKVVVF